MTASEPAGPEDRDAAVAHRLRTAAFEPIGRFADASNATLLVRLTDRDPRPLDELALELGRPPELTDLDPADLAVHKPRRGEAPLWDFPDGTLHRREVAAYEVSAALGWDLVPVTVRREDGPFGPGSLQRFVDHDPEQHYFTLWADGGDEVRAQLTAMVVFDLVIDNADRKAGHVLRERSSDRIRVVDHGVSFHVEDKLRTVAWELAGEPVPTPLRAAVASLAARLEGDLGGSLAALLDDAEVARLRARAAAVAELASFPHPLGPRAYPWPLW